MSQINLENLRKFDSALIYMLNENEITVVHISKSLSSKLIVQFMDKYPNLEIITCPKSIYDRIPKKYIEALNQLDIEVKVKYNWGNNSKFDEEIGEKALNLFKKGFSAKDISEKLNIPLKSVYYLKYKYSKNGFKFNNLNRSKYPKELIDRVQNYRKDGFSAIDISKRENIPIRTVYYLNSIK